MSAPQAECDANQPPVDGSARAAFGYAPDTRKTVACSPLSASAKAQARPLNAPEATDPNDPARLRDIP